MHYIVCGFVISVEGVTVDCLPPLRALTPHSSEAPPAADRSSVRVKVPRVTAAAAAVENGEDLRDFIVRSADSGGERKD